MKIILPECGLEVQLAALDWPQSKKHFTDAIAAAGEGNADNFLESFLKRHYPQDVWEKALVKRPDAMVLYNDTIRYNFSGPEAVKNSSRSGSGQPTQTA